MDEMDKKEKMEATKLEFTKDLIRSMMFFGLVHGWEPTRIVDELTRLDIPESLVHETLNEGIE